MRVWAATFSSCDGCNVYGVAVFDRIPEPEELKALKLQLGGMFCITERVTELETDGTLHEWSAAR